MPGVESTVMIQYVARFQSAKTTSTPISTGDIAFISAQTSEKLATLFFTYHTTARTRATDIPILRSWRDLLFTFGGGELTIPPHLASRTHDSTPQATV